MFLSLLYFLIQEENFLKYMNSGTNSQRNGISILLYGKTRMLFLSLLKVTVTLLAAQP